MATMAPQRIALRATPRFRMSVSVVMAVSGLALLLAGCSNALTITPGGHELPRCAVQGEVLVEQLDQPALHDCNAEGVTIRLPDGWDVVQVPAVGTTFGSTRSDRPGEIGMVNWGIEGVGVSLRNGDVRTIWGTSDAAAQRQSAATR
ncbi:hypothetical protein ABIC28_005135 [Rhodococcus sp. PvR044]|uniref:hypothetical protein n=1 Tax=Rhodococcus sp. PvR044 TaxID=3156402 RepID=UPI00339245A9